MKILAIETSCDETAISLVKAQGGLERPQFGIVHNIVSSQIAIHAPFGGVVPNLAKREHLKNLPHIWNRIKKFAKNTDLIAVTVGPGLEPALWPGINFSIGLGKELEKPVIGVNHLEGHLYSFLANRKTKNKKQKRESIFPAIALVVSGGHTILLLLQSLTKWQKLGETRDDAAGEAFDKVAKILRLPYPGGPQIEKLARRGNPTAIDFPRPMLNQKNYEFSFSGLKTSVLYYLRDNQKANKRDVAASFQRAVIDVLVGKTIRAVREFGARSVLLSGGVAANRAIRKELNLKCEKSNVKLFVPPSELNTDNAAMIGIAAYIRFLQKKKPIQQAQGKKLRLIAQPNLSL